MTLSYRNLNLPIPLPLMQLIKRKMRYVRAAGGVVTAADGRRLLIQRHGKADLPKGMVEPGESLLQTALREVHEETGIECTATLPAGRHTHSDSASPYPAPLLKTYHIYNQYGGWHLKQTSWFAMTPLHEGGPTTPQQDEGISAAEWVDPRTWRHQLRHSYGTMRTLALLSLLILCLFPPLAAHAQHPWDLTLTERYSVQQAYLSTPPAHIRKQIKLNLPLNTCYHLVGPSRGKYQLIGADTSFTLATEQLTLLTPYMVSVHYWDTRFAQLLDWQYLEANRTMQLVDLDTTRLLLGRYTPLHFLSYHFQPSMEYPVVFTVLTNNHRPQTLSLSALDRLAEWGAFTTDADMQWQEQHLDAIATDHALRAAANQQTLDSLSLLSSRSRVQSDSILAALQADSLQAEADRLHREVEATKQRMRRDKIFVMNIKPAQSDYMFGLEFNFYNCFDKTITKLEITVLPCDKKGRVQPDKFKRTERTVRCMGPIRPGEPAQYTFDELFWDDSHRISYLRTTSITLHFTDGTHRTFSGTDQIRRHSLAK